jgi:predicted secreted protein
MEKFGYGGSVKLGANTVSALKDWKLNIDAAELDASYFGDGWKQNKTGIRNWSVTSSGNFVIDSDTNGQTAIQNALINNTSLSIKLYVDDTHYYSGTVYVKKAGIDATASDFVKVDFEYVGSGTLSYN